MDEVINLLLNLSPEQRIALNIILTKAKEEQNRGATVFTDGSCRNQGKSNAKAGFGVFWGDDHPNNHSGKVDGLQDNNRAELYAACHAIRQALRLGYRKIRILSDSEFVRLVIQKPQDFENKMAYIDYQDLIQSIDLMRRSIEVSVEYVKAYSGHYGNVKADGLAKIGVRTVSLEMIARYTKKIRKFAAGRAKSSAKSSGKPEERSKKKSESTQSGTAKKANMVSKKPSTCVSTTPKLVVQRQKKAAPKPKNVNAKTPPQLPKTPSPTPKKPAHLKTPRSSNLASLVRSISKISLTTTLTATQKRKQRRQRAKVLAQLDGAKDARGALKMKKGEVKKTTSGKAKTVQNGQNQRKKNEKKTSTK